MKHRKMGKFYVSYEAVDSGRIAPALAKMQFVPFRVEALHYADRFEYVGTSPLFQEMDPATVIPEYDIIINDLGPDITVSATPV
jgi:hypothetical protein